MSRKESSVWTGGCCCCRRRCSLCEITTEHGVDETGSGPVGTVRLCGAGGGMLFWAAGPVVEEGCVNKPAVVAGAGLAGGAFDDDGHGAAGAVLAVSFVLAGGCGAAGAT